MKMNKEINLIQVSAKNPPVITLDSETKAVYIKFSKNKIVKTLDDSANGAIITIDLDAKNNVVGVELIGVKRFTITGTVKMLSRKISGMPDLTNAKLTAC